MAGWVYVFANSAAPKHVKVGYTEREPAIRARELATTGLPGEYVVEFCVVVDNPKEVEREAHVLLGDVHCHKEWFECSAEVATRAIQAAVRKVGREAAPSDEDEDEDADCPLVPGHALRQFYVAAKGDLPQAKFRVDPDPKLLRPVVGTMAFTCRFCGHSFHVPVSHVVRCAYCGKTDVLY